MKTVIEMAKEAGIDEWWDSGSEWRETFNERLERLVELARADAIASEREACAKVCDDLYRVWTLTDDDEITPPDALDCKRAIRARGQK